MGRPPSVPYPNIGDKFNSWTCIAGPIKDEKTKRTSFKWRCDCGFEKLERHTDVVKGRSKQCIECAKGGDLAQQTFGKWTVIEYAGINARGERAWRCQCSCEAQTISIIGTGTLQSGNSQACKKCNAGVTAGAEAIKEKAREEAIARRELLRGKVPNDWFALPRTKSEALEKGEVLYFYGECQHGHIELHHTSYGCLSCNRESRKKWEAKNPEKLKAIAKRKYKKNSKDPAKRMLSSLRTRTAYAFKNIDSIKDKSTLELLGCTAKELKEWIEPQFHPNPRTGELMSWSNFGKISDLDDTWNVDHKTPLSSARDVESLKNLIHYKNLQPMWALDNVIKGSMHGGKKHGERPGPKGNQFRLDDF